MLLGQGLLCAGQHVQQKIPHRRDAKGHSSVRVIRGSLPPPSPSPLPLVHKGSLAPWAGCPLHQGEGGGGGRGQEHQAPPLPPPPPSPWAGANCTEFALAGTPKISAKKKSSGWQCQRASGSGAVSNLVGRCVLVGHCWSTVGMMVEWCLDGVVMVLEYG